MKKNILQEFFNGRMHSNKVSERNLIRDYISSGGIIADEPIGLPFYKNYLVRFDFIPYVVPLELKHVYDWDFFQKLIVSSLSSNYDFIAPETNESLVELEVTLSGQNIAKRISDLSENDIVGMFNIYLDEQLHYYILGNHRSKVSVTFENLKMDKIQEFIKKTSDLYLADEKIGSSDCLFNLGAFFDKESREESPFSFKLKKYISYGGSRPTTPSDLLFYNDYVGEFEPTPYKTPKYLNSCFDWNFFLQLVASSSSCGYKFLTQAKQLSELEITVAVSNQHITRKVSDLTIAQITRLYEIFLREQIELYNIIQEGGEDVPQIIQDRRKRLERHQAMILSQKKVNKANLLMERFYTKRKG